MCTDAILNMRGSGTLTVLVMVADRKCHVDSAIIDSNVRTKFQVQAAYCLLFAMHSNSSWANFGPNERMAV